MGDSKQPGLDTEAIFQLDEARRITSDNGDVRTMGNQRFGQAETEAAATTGDEDTLPFERFHFDSSVIIAVD
jgi:hypothetical protein